MDSLRAVLIVGGILFHAALPYRATGDWNVKEAHGSTAFDYLSAALSAFRMPLFFFVAGYFCAMTFSSRHATANLRRRLRVFGIPLAVFIITVQPLQHALRWSAKHPGPLNAGFDASGFWHSYVSTGSFISHLWFLVNLIVYYCMAYAVLMLLAQRKTLQRRLECGAMALPIWLVRSKTMLALVCAVLVFPAYGLLGRIPKVPGFSVEDLALYLPFFLAGYFCYPAGGMMNEMSEVQALDAVMLTAGILLLLSSRMTSEAAVGFLSIWLFYQAAWTIGMLVLQAFRRWFDIANPVMRAISDASYTIYLFHHVIVILLATLLVGISLPGGLWAKYGFVVIVTFLATFMLHHFVIRRHGTLSMLFNGR
ncbi:MAG: acyltransferase family protein [Sinobacteraceae bacterium]|nr:acyltransferase family protein [Nevskiaceae bacterium]